MSSRNRTRTQPCDQRDASTRISSAEKFLEVARLIEGEDEGAFGSVATSLAVLAGIAASDAACCSALGRRARGDDHHDAEALLETIVPSGKEAAIALHRLIDLKDKAQYGIIFVSRDELKVAMRQSQKLVDFAKAVRRR